MSNIPLADQIACVEREIAMRGRVYPRWCASGKITATKASTEIAAMRAVLSTLQNFQAAAESGLVKCSNCSHDDIVISMLPEPLPSGSLARGIGYVMCRGCGQTVSFLAFREPAVEGQHAWDHACRQALTAQQLAERDQQMIDAVMSWTPTAEVTDWLRELPARLRP